ncbi:hypothetical protein LX36DRAFT_662638 [Colletotrichum falcatum]|nr:hypothetical protein LX36DRAFT_662638 [Colletotrichum falcatum]
MCPEGIDPRRFLSSFCPSLPGGVRLVVIVGFECDLSSCLSGSKNSPLRCQWLAACSLSNAPIHLPSSYLWFLVERIHWLGRPSPPLLLFFVCFPNPMYPESIFPVYKGTSS